MRLFMSTQVEVPTRKRLNLEEWIDVDSSRALSNSIAKLIGSSLQRSPIISQILRHEDVTFGNFRITNIQLFRCKFGKSVLTIEVVHPKALDPLKLRKLSHKFWGEALNMLGLKQSNFLSIDALVYAIFEGETKATDLIVDGIAEIKSSEPSNAFAAEVAIEILSRVSIERSLLYWAMQTSSAANYFSLRTARSAYFLRRWPVELLFDREFISQRYRKFRESLNFPNVREGILERARSWWSLLANILAGISLAIGFIAIFGTKG